MFFNNTVNVTKYFDEKREPMKATNFKIYYCRLKKKNFFLKVLSTMKLLTDLSVNQISSFYMLVTVKIIVCLNAE